MISQTDVLMLTPDGAFILSRFEGSRSMRLRLPIVPMLHVTDDHGEIPTAMQPLVSSRTFARLDARTYEEV